MVFKVLILHENTELLPSVDHHDLYPGNNDPTEGIKLLLFGIPFRNQFGWLKVAKED